MLQQRTIIGLRPQHARDDGLRRTGDAYIPLAANTLQLVRGQLVSPWRPLRWFWCLVLCLAVGSGLLLELLGPPSERVADDQPLADLSQPLRPLAEPRRPAPAPAAIAAVRPEPGPQPPRGRPAPDAQTADSVAQQNAQPGARAAMVLHPARSDDGTATATRLAALAGLAPEQIEVGASGDTKKAAIIRFYSTDDHALARRLGKELRRMGYAWRIENFADRSWAWKDQAIEVWLPEK